MKKISVADEAPILKLLRKWPPSERLTWERLRTAIVEASEGRIAVAWTRQALFANGNVRAAFAAAKVRLAKRASAKSQPAGDDNARRIQELESELAEQRARYAALQNRHLQLIYNASLLDGGTHLLDDPLPDNTRS